MSRRKGTEAPGTTGPGQRVWDGSRRQDWDGHWSTHAAPQLPHTLYHRGNVVSVGAVSTVTIGVLETMLLRSPSVQSVDRERHNKQADPNCQHKAVSPTVDSVWTQSHGAVLYFPQCTLSGLSPLNQFWVTVLLVLLEWLVFLVMTLDVLQQLLLL